MMAENRADIYLGRLVKAFGIKGDIKLNPSDDFWDSVLESRELRLKVESDGEISESPVRLERSRRHGNAYVLKLEGVNDRNEAELLVGAELFIPRERIDVEPPDEIMPYQLIGCSVRTQDGARIGSVTGVLFTPAHPIYEVTGDTGVNLIPAVPEFVIEVNIDGGEIIIRTIPGLLNDES
jgi:16S rRNA processing protein RimM